MLLKTLEPGRGALLADPELEPPVVPADLEPPAPEAVREPRPGRLGRLLEEAAHAGSLAEMLSLLEVKWDASEHPRWPAGTPGGLGGKFMRVGQRIKLKGVEYDVDQVLPGGVYAHVATHGDIAKAAYVWLPATKEAGSGHMVVKGAARPPAEAIYGAKHVQTAEKFTATIADPYVQADHDASIPVPDGAPPELTPARWQRFGRADQLRYADLMREFGKWSPGKAQGLVDQALAKQEPAVVSFVQGAYSSQYGSSSAFTIGFHQVFSSLLGLKPGQAQLEKARTDYENAKAVQDAAARAIQWDLYNRVRAPEVSIFHKSGDSSGWWKSNMLTGKVPVFSGLSQTQRYQKGGFGHVAVATPVAIRNVVMATTSADIYKHHSFQGEQEVSVGDPMRLDGRSLVFDDSELTPGQSKWLTQTTAHGADGTAIEMLRGAMEKGETLPIPPEPAMIQMHGAGAVTWAAPPPEARKGVAALAYAEKDANGAPVAKPANTLDLEPGDYVEGMQGTRYIILKDTGNPFGIRYYKVTDTGQADSKGGFTGHTEFGGEESYEFEGNGVKPFKKLAGHFELPTQAEESHTGFVPTAWSETSEKKLVGELPPGTKFKVSGVPYELTEKLSGAQYGLKNLDSGLAGTINTSYKTPWLVLKEGYTEEGVPAFNQDDFFVHPASSAALAATKPGDVFLAGASGDMAWKITGIGPGEEREAVGLVGKNQGKKNVFQLTQTVRRLEPKPVGWQPAAVGDTLALDGQKGEVTKLLKGGVVQVNLKPGVVKLKPDDPRLAGLFRADAHHLGEKQKLRDIGVGEKFHGGTGGKVRPYLVLEKGLTQKQAGKKGKFARVRNLDTGEETWVSEAKSFARLLPHGVDEPELGAPGTPTDYGAVFNPEAWKQGAEAAAVELQVGDKYVVPGSTGYYEVTGDKGAVWEIKDLLSGKVGALTKGGFPVTRLEPSGVVPATSFDPDAYDVGPAKPLSELKKGDIFKGTKKGKHYLVTKTGAKSGLSALDLETGKVSSPWDYSKVAPVLEPKSLLPNYADLKKGDLTHLSALAPGDQFLHAGQVLEVVSPPAGKESNATVAPVLPDGGLGHPGQVGYYPDLLVTFHAKEADKVVVPPVVEVKDSTDLETMPEAAFAAFSPKSKTGGGYVFTKAKNAGKGALLQDKEGSLFKVVAPGPDPIVSDGSKHMKMPGELNLKVVEQPFDDHAGPLDMGHAVGQGDHLDAETAAGPALIPTEKTVAELGLEKGDVVQLKGKVWTVYQPLQGVGSFSEMIATSDAEGNPNLIGKELVPDAVGYQDNGKQLDAFLAAPSAPPAGTEAALKLKTSFEQMSSSAGKAKAAADDLNALIGAPPDDEYAENVVKLQLGQLQPGTWVKSHAANAPWKMVGPDPAKPGWVLVQTPSGVESHAAAGVPDLVHPGATEAAIDAAKGGFVKPPSGTTVADLAPGDQFKGDGGTVWEVTGPPDVGSVPFKIISSVDEKAVGKTGSSIAAFEPLLVKKAAVVPTPGPSDLPSADPDDYEEGGKTTLDKLTAGAFFKSVTGKVFRLDEAPGHGFDAVVTNVETGQKTNAAASMPTVWLKPKSDAAKGLFTETDRQLVQALKDAQDTGDDVDAYFNAEDAIHAHLGLHDEDDAEVVQQKFDAYLAGVGAQYGIDVDAGAPEPNLGPLDTWTGDLPVGAEFEDLDGEKWRVISTDADVMKAELIADPEQTKTYVSEPDDTGEDSPDEMVRVLDWGPHGPTVAPGSQAPVTELGQLEPGDSFTVGAGAGFPAGTYTVIGDAPEPGGPVPVGPMPGAVYVTSPDTGTIWLGPGLNVSPVGKLDAPGYAGQQAYTLEKGDKFFRGSDPVPWTVTASSGKGVKKKVTAQTPGGATATLDPGEVVKKHQGFPLDGAQVGDTIHLSGKDYTITSDEGEAWAVSLYGGQHAGVIHKTNALATLSKGSAAGLEELPPNKLGPPDDWQPFSAKSKTGGGYKFADLDALEPQAKFRDKSGKTYYVVGKTPDGYYTKFAEVGGDGTIYWVPGGPRVKLP